jgi:hypothetical protein
MARVFARLTLVVLAFAVAMAYVESAVVVYLRAALGVGTGDVFPIDLSPQAVPFGAVELGREAATLVMIGAVGWIVGRRGWERLAWAAVVFGAWDIGYYFWLWEFSGWPGSLTTWDLLFLLPVPWAGPIWAPIVVSLLLIGFGLALASRYRAGLEPTAGAPHLAGLLVGGLVVIVSFVLNAGVVLDEGVPTEFAWPVFVAGLGIGVVAAWAVMRSAGAGRLRV